MNRRDIIRGIPAGIGAVLGLGALAPALAKSQQDDIVSFIYTVNGDEAVAQATAAITEAADAVAVDIERNLAWSILMREGWDAQAGEANDYLNGEGNGLAIAARCARTYAPDHSFDHDWAVATLFTHGLPRDGHSYGWGVDDQMRACFEQDRAAFIREMEQGNLLIHAATEAKRNEARIALAREGEKIQAQLDELAANGKRLATEIAS